MILPDNDQGENEEEDIMNNYILNKNKISIKNKFKFGQLKEKYSKQHVEKVISLNRVVAAREKSCTSPLISQLTIIAISFQNLLERTILQ